MFRLFTVSLALLISSCAEKVKNSYKVSDGDSFVQITADNTTGASYELAFIDAPEREQPYGREAKQYLKEVLLDERLIMKTISDSTVELFINGQSVNLLMVSKGVAWASLQTPNETIKQKYFDAQKRATENMQGIWGLEHGLMIAPWQWRAQGQEKTPSMNYQKQLMLKKQKEIRAQKDAAMQRQRSYAKQKALQQQKLKNELMNKTANKPSMTKD